MLTLPSDVSDALQELKKRLLQLYGERLKGIYLYGSYARGDFSEGSDVDVLVVLEGIVVPGEEISRMNLTVSQVCLRYDLLISIYPVSAENFEKLKTIFLEQVRKEAVPL